MVGARPQNLSMKKATTSGRYPQGQPLLAQTKRLLHQFDLKARKGLAQHFLIDEEALKLITSVAELDSHDIVVEVGPGLGVLTKELARQAGWVVAVEIDSQLAAMLGQTLTSFHNIKIVNNDILGIKPADLLAEPGGGFPGVAGSPSQYKVVADLPYYITAPVLRHFLEASVKPQSMVVMVQKEVAEVVAARSGRMSILSVSVQVYGEPTIVGYVPAQSFYPAPEVNSAILRIRVYPEPAVAMAGEPSFFTLVRAGFSATRKQIGNSLAKGLDLPKTEVLPLLEAAGIAARRRAETLDIQEWAQLWEVCASAGRLPC
ncbi:16S rRNA (adenine(1518)-N(6)/adenine(1519)-N(6))-dimethyltransferase RsmA [Chloroflexota bacterium]